MRLEFCFVGVPVAVGEEVSRRVGEWPVHETTTVMQFDAIRATITAKPSGSVPHGG